jgi:uncharacterized membrane protein YbhN (UPF0104 family)
MSGESRSFWRRNRKRALSAVVGALVTAGFFYFVVPRIVGLGPTLRALRSGDVGWLLLGVVVEAGSVAGDIVTFQGVFAARGTPIGWRRTADLRLAGAAATKLLAAAGAGGIALTVWAPRGWGLSGTDVADGMACYEILTYGVYMIALAGAGWGLWFGVFSGPHPLAVLVTGYYVGTLGTALPLPGGIGGVEGGMIGAFIGFGVKAPLATIAVLAYRTISYWLPTIPGVIAYIHLRHDLGTHKAGGSGADH